MSTQVKYPVMVCFTDFSFGVYQNEHLFFQSSGCEEEDFSKVTRYLFDSTGHIVEVVYKADSASLILTENKLSAIKVYLMYKNHLKRWASQTNERLSFIHEASSWPTELIIKKGNDLLVF